MRAMILEKPGAPLRLLEKPDPIPGPGQVLVKILACGVCRTDLHVVDGDLTEPKLPIIPGHEIIGTISALGDGVDHFKLGERVGIPWLGRTCGCCFYCESGAENLCDEPGFTGYQIDGGFADVTVADARFCFPIGDDFSDAELAPWRISLPKLPATKIAKSMPLPAPAIWPRRNLPSKWVRYGREAPTVQHPLNWTRRSSSPRLARWFQSRCGPFVRAG